MPNKINPRATVRVEISEAEQASLMKLKGAAKAVLSITNNAEDAKAAMINFVKQYELCRPHIGSSDERVNALAKIEASKAALSSGSINLLLELAVNDIDEEYYDQLIDLATQYPHLLIAHRDQIKACAAFNIETAFCHNKIDSAVNYDNLTYSTAAVRDTKDEGCRLFADMAAWQYLWAYLNYLCDDNDSYLVQIADQPQNDGSASGITLYDESKLQGVSYN